MKTLTKRLLNKSNLSLLLVGILIFSIIAGAALAVPVPVLALSAGGIKTTIASIVLSLLLQTGVGVIDQAYVQKLNNAYGAESQFGTIEDMVANNLLVDENGVLNDNGLENAIQSVPEYEELFLGDLFSIAEGSAIGVAASTGAHNLMTTAISCGTLGTIGAFGGAAAIGVGLGILINNVRENIGKLISNDIPMSYAEAMGTYVTEGSTTCTYYKSNGYKQVYIFSPNTFAAVVKDENLLYARSTVNGADIQYRRMFFDKNDNMYLNDIITIGGTNISVEANRCTGVTIYNTETPYNNKLNEILSGASNKPGGTTGYYTGPYGNQAYEFDNSGNTVIPGIKSMIPDGYDMMPVSVADYLDYINQAQNDYNNNVSQNIIADNFNNFVNEYITEEAEKPEDIYNPSIPDTNNPTVPDQPTIPDKPDITVSDRNDSLIGTTEGLQNVFPFCIPFDIYALLTGLSAERRAPSLHVPLGEGHYLDVDLQDYESAAQILRALELIAFIVGLAVATRSLIGAKG